MTQYNHPYIEKKLHATLAVHYKLFECLNKRLALIGENKASKTEYEKNEIEISIIKTQAEIDSRRKEINAKEMHFKMYIPLFVDDAEEVEQNFDALLELAQLKKEKILGLKEYLQKKDLAALDLNIEAKIATYKQLKEFMK